MFKVDNRNEALAKKIVNSNSDMSFAGVLAGNNVGEVWVDDLENPRAAIVFYQGQTGFQFMGEFTQKLLEEQLSTFVDVTAKQFLKGKADYFDFAADDQKALEIIKGILAQRKTYENTQYVYLKKGDKKSHATPLPGAREINSTFIKEVEEGSVTNPEFLMEYIKDWWGTVDKFLNKGYGFAHIEDGEIVSYAISSSAFDKVQAIGVETLKDYRKRGLAAALTASLLQLFEEKGISPWWDCTDTNIPSQKTAEKNGLEFDYKYKVCTIKY